MSRIKELIKSTHVQISFVTGISIIILAYFSKCFLPEPLSYLELAFPPFIMTIYEAVLSKFKGRKICGIWIWNTAIFLATAIIILTNF